MGCLISNMEYEEGEITYGSGQYVEAPISNRWNTQWDKAIEAEKECKKLFKRKRCEEIINYILRRKPCKTTSDKISIPLRIRTCNNK